MPEIRRNDRESGRESRSRATLALPPQKEKSQQGTKRMRSLPPPTTRQEMPGKYQLDAQRKRKTKFRLRLPIRHHIPRSRNLYRSPPFVNQNHPTTTLLATYPCLNLPAQPKKITRSPPFSKEAKHHILCKENSKRKRLSNTSHPLEPTHTIKVPELQATGQPPITQSEDYLMHV